MDKFDYPLTKWLTMKELKEPSAKGTESPIQTLTRAGCKEGKYYIIKKKNELYAIYTKGTQVVKGVYDDTKKPRSVPKYKKVFDARY